MKKTAAILIALILFLGCDNKEAFQKQTNLNLEFIYSIKNNNLEEATKFLEEGAQINAEDDYKRTVLIHASINNNLNIVEYLISLPDIIIDKEDYSGKTAFEYASLNNKIEMLKLLINAGADVNTDSDGGNTLVRAVENDKMEAVKLLISAGSDLNSRNAYGLTPVMIVVEKNNIETLQLLLENGSDVNARVINSSLFLDDWPEGATAIYSARLQGNIEMVDMLLEAGAESYLQINPDLNDNLFLNTESFNNEKVKILIDDGADVNAFNEKGMSPLMIAVEKDNYELVKILIARGADINGRVPIKREYWARGTTALIIAANRGSTNIFKLLLTAGADINIKEYYGNTAKLEAKNNGHSDIYQILLDLENSMQ